MKNDLEQYGYHYNFDGEIYVNKENKTVITEEFYEDNSSAIQGILANPNSGDDWIFHSNDEFSDEKKKEIIDRYK